MDRFQIFIMTGGAIMETNASLQRTLPGQSVTVRRLTATGGMRRRLMDLGFVQGAQVTCIQKSPLGDPTAYWVRGAVIAIRDNDAQTVLVD